MNRPIQYEEVLSRIHNVIKGMALIGRAIEVQGTRSSFKRVAFTQVILAKGSDSLWIK